jgi:hypothetical protein
MAETGRKPGYTVRVFVSNEDIEHLRRLSETTGVNQSDIQARILSAGIAAVVANGYRLSLPLTLHIADEAAGVSYAIKQENHAAMNEGKGKRK